VRTCAAAYRSDGSSNARGVAVRAAYGMKGEEDPLTFLLRLNLELADQEAKGQPITPPGLLSFVPNPANFISRDRIEAPQ
jgi:hypothetical protein